MGGDVPVLWPDRVNGSRVVTPHQQVQRKAGAHPEQEDAGRQSNGDAEPAVVRPTASAFSAEHGADPRVDFARRAFLGHVAGEQVCDAAILFVHGDRPLATFGPSAKAQNRRRASRSRP